MLLAVIGSRPNQLLTANPSFVARQLFSRSVQRLVLFLVGCHEFFISLARIPEIEREVNCDTKRITQKASLAVVGVAPEQPDPLLIRALGVFESFFTTRLDFGLPQRYKHRGPISCSLDVRHSASNFWELSAPSGRV